MLFSTRSIGIPLVVDLLVVDGFSLMSLAATLEPLRAANRVSGRALYDWRLLSPDGRPALSSSGLPIPVAAALDPKSRRDALIVVAAFEAERRAAGLATRLRAVARARTPLGGIESGSWILAKAGLLDGYRATAHWEEVEEFAAAYAAIDVVADRFVIDRDRFTAGGATPALDMMLHLIRVQHGMTIALNVASIFIYDQEHLPADRQSIVQVGRLGFVEPRLTAAIRLMEESLEDPLTVARIAAQIGLSARSMQTLFVRHLGAPPRAYYLDLRLDAARRLLQQTRRGLMEIAVACGFASASTFSRAFRRRYGRSPRELRREGITTGALRRTSSSIQPQRG
jgi:AraC family transcriptional regulator, glycine betaine-responsive activator